jgi:VanZ family protein
MLDQPMFTAGRRSAFRQFLFYWLPVLLYVTAIFAVSSLSLPPNPIPMPDSDKIYHMCEYGLLGLLMGRALRHSVAPYSALAASMMTVALVMMVAAADEYYQSFVPGRTCDMFDWLADAGAGVLSQVVLWQLWSRFGRDRAKRADA